MNRHAVILTLCILQSAALLAQAPIPDWCRALPRPEYKTVERVSISDPCFEVYKPAQGVFAIYEPHQAEETISYLIVGEKRALLFDTGMGISGLKKVIAQLTKLPIILLNSHKKAKEILERTGAQDVSSTGEASSDQSNQIIATSITASKPERASASVSDSEAGGRSADCRHPEDGQSRRELHFKCRHSSRNLPLPL